MCCDVLTIQWCCTMELYLCVRNELWCVANTVRLYCGIVFICKRRVVMCCQYSDVIFWNCIYSYGTCCDVNTVMLYYGIVFICMERVVMCCHDSDVILWNDVLPIQWWCYICKKRMELYLFVFIWNVLWCVANTVMLYYGIVFICKKRVVMCCQYSDVILRNCIYLYGTCCDVLPIQWCYTMELYLFVWNVLWCVANTVMLYYGIVFICKKRVVICCQYSNVILWNCIYLYGTCCDVLPIQWCYTMELYLFVWNVLWCVANTVMLYYGIVFICMERETCCDVLPIQWCYTIELYLFVRNVLWCVRQYSDVILWNCIYLYGTCCDVLPIQWCYTMELYLFVRNVLWCVAITVMLYYGIVFIWNKRVVICCQYSDVILWNCIYLYGTCCDVLPIQWGYTMELYLFVRNVL